MAISVADRNLVPQKRLSKKERSTQIIEEAIFIFASKGFRYLTMLRHALQKELNIQQDSQYAFSAD